MTQSINASQQSWMWAYAFALLVTPLVGWFELLEPFGRDQGIHATIAFALDDGLVTYRDVFNMKPPMTTAVHWLSQAVFGHSMMAIRALDLCIMTLSALGLVAIGRALRLGLAFGFAAPLALATLYFSYGFWEHAQTDGWAGMLVIGALWMMTKGWAREAGGTRIAYMVGAGLFLGVAFGLKYTIGATGALVLAPLFARWIGRDPERFHLSDLIAATIGGVGFLAVLVGVMALFGALGPFFEIQDFIRGYIGYGASISPSLGQELLLIGMPSTYLVAVVALGVVMAIWLWRSHRRVLPLIVGLIWVVTGLISGHVQGKGFTYHYLPMLPAYAFLAGIAVAELARFASRGATRVAVVVALLAILYLPSQAARFNLFYAAKLGEPDPRAAVIAAVPAGTDFDIGGNVAFAAALSERRAPDDGLFVWGYGTMLYFLTGEPPRYRYAYSWPFLLSYYDGQYTDDLLERLRADPPRHFVVQSQDATPWVTDNEKDSEQALADYPQIEAFVTEGYRLVLEHERFKLYERVAG